MTSEFMELALKLARKADPFPNPKVGALIVKDGRVIGQGHHKGPGRPHAEIEAIADARKRTGDPRCCEGATLYVTLEPCSHTLKRTPPCTIAIMEAGLKKVVYGMDDPNPLVDGAGELEASGVEVDGPLCPKEAARMNRRYIHAVTEKPLVIMKMALSADGKSATRLGDSKWISGERSRRMVHRMRASCDALIVGAGTVMMDDPGLTSHGIGRDPYRVIVDGSLRISPDAKALKRKDGKAIIATTTKAPVERLAALSGARILFCGDDEVDLKMLAQGLSAMGMKRIMIEGGSELNARALRSGIVDRIIFFIAPKLIGGIGAKGVVGGIGIGMMDEAPGLKLRKMERIGEDILLEYDVL